MKRSSVEKKERQDAIDPVKEATLEHFTRSFPRKMKRNREETEQVLPLFLIKLLREEVRRLIAEENKARWTSH